MHGEPCDSNLKDSGHPAGDLKDSGHPREDTHRDVASWERLVLAALHPSVLAGLCNALTAGDGIAHVDARNRSTAHLVPTLLRLLTTGARDGRGTCQKTSRYL